MSDITPNQWTILERLEQGPCWIRSLHTVRPLLNDLIERGLVERCRPRMGRANNMARLTDAGCAKLEIDPDIVPSEPPAKTERLHETKRWNLQPIKENTTKLIRQTCETFVRYVKTGSAVADAVGQLAETEGVQRPAIWRRLREGGVLSPLRTNVRKLPPAPRKAFEPELPPPVIYRDSCPRCGVRGDIGCRHNRAPLGMMF